MEHVEEILAQCWKELDFHNDGTSKLHYSEPQREFNYVDDGEEIPHEDATRKLREQIKLSLEEYGAVYLYTCRDNLLISIETDIPTHDELDLFEKIDDLPLWVAYD